MRILAYNHVFKGDLTVFTINDTMYDEDFEGIGLFANDDKYYYIPHVSLDDYNEMCRNLLINGYCDLTKYGEIHEF